MSKVSALMPIYHFNVFNDAQGDSPDWDGMELPDAETAGREAVRLAGAMIADSASVVPCPVVWHLDVTDDGGTTLFSLDFTIRPTMSRLARHVPSMRELYRRGIGAQ